MSQRILVVEDDPGSLKFITLVLTRKGGYQVVATEDVKKILDLAAKKEVDLVLMDVSLTKSMYKGEGVNGLDIATMLKHNPQTADIPILLATAHVMAGDKEHFLARSGADGCIAKPIKNPQELVDKVKLLLEKNG